MPPPSSSRPTKSRHREAGRKKNHCPVVARDRSSGSTSRTSVLGNSQSSDAEGECSAAETTVKEEPCHKAESDSSGCKIEEDPTDPLNIFGPDSMPIKKEIQLGMPEELKDAQPTSSGSAREEPPAQTKFGKLHPETVSELKRKVALLTVDRKKTSRARFGRTQWRRSVRGSRLVARRRCTRCGV